MADLYQVVLHGPIECTRLHRQVTSNSRGETARRGHIWNHTVKGQEYTVNMRKEALTHVFAQTVSVFLAILLCESFLAQPANSQQCNQQDDLSSPFVGPSALVHAEAIDAEG